VRSKCAAKAEFSPALAAAVHPSVVRIPRTRRVHDSQRDFVKLLLRNFIRSRLQL